MIVITCCPDFQEKERGQVHFMCLPLFLHEIRYTTFELVMKRFALYYKRQRCSHGRLYGVIEAEDVICAFKKAVKCMRADGLDPDEFKEFYVAPVEADNSVRYRKQCHGWDECGEFPRE
jgi:hypothetical protein